MQNRNALLEGPILKSLLRLAIPIVLANILQAGYQLVDAFWVGRLGGYAVAAVSVSTPVMFLTLGLGTGFAIAGSVLIAQYYGAGNHRMVSHVAAQTLLMVTIVSILLGTIAYIFTPNFLRLLKVAPEVYSGAKGFMRVSFIGLVFNFSFFVFQSIMRGIGNATVPVYIVLGTVILNFALDPLFIFGWGLIKGGSVFLRTMCLSWGFMGLQMSLTGVLRASGNMVQVMMLTIVSQWVLQFPLAYVFSHQAGLGERGIWIAFPIANIAIALVTIGIYAKGDWKKKRLTNKEEKLSEIVTEETLIDEGIHR